MIRLHNVKIPLDYTKKTLAQAACKKLGCTEGQIACCEISKKSVDARKKNDVCFVVSLDVTLKNPQDEKRIAARLAPSEGGLAVPYAPPAVPKLRTVPALRPIVVGFGPAGLFAALTLAEASACPIVLERGQDVDTRTRDVQAYWENGQSAFKVTSNVQFGEGGAGTFSDGKLNTGVNNPRIGWVLEQFVQAGAREDILYDAKPHVGTDVLLTVVQNLRKRILSLGGEVRFNTRVTGLCVEGSRLTGLKTDAGEIIDCDAAVLAIGHSARDTFEMLDAMGVPMEPKPFAMGARIEQRQSVINRAQYGSDNPALPPADYKLVEHLEDATVYTFCMCPGGHVVAAASEAGRIVTNGMSNSDREGENANAALLVTVNPADFPYAGVLGGMRWQREIEERAYNISGSYRAPTQKVGDFLAHRPSTGAGSVNPTYRPGVT